MPLTTITSTNIGANAVTGSGAVVTFSNTVNVNTAIYVPDSGAMLRRYANTEWVLGYDAPSKNLSLGSAAASASNNTLSMYAGAKLAINVNASGIVSTPFKPFVNGYPNGAAVSTTTKTSLTSSTVQNATFSNSRFTCPIAGLYECVLNTTVQTGYNENDLWVYKNGSPLNPVMGSWAAVNPDWVSVHMQVVIPCAANDYLEFYWRGNMYGNSSWNYFHFMHVG